MWKKERRAKWGVAEAAVVYVGEWREGLKEGNGRTDYGALRHHIGRYLNDKKHGDMHFCSYCVPWQIYT
jgi:hypothetical protein